MNKKRFLLATVLFSLALIFCLGNLQTVLAAEPIIIKFSDPGSAKLGRSRAAVDTMKEIERLTGGRVKHEIYWSGSLLKIRDTLAGIGSGIADVGYPVAVIYHHKRFPVWQFAQLLYTGGPSQDGVSWALNEMYDTNPVLKKEFDDQNVAVLTFSSTGSTLLVSTKPLKKKSDFKGMRLRTVSTTAKLVAALGATPVGLPIYETPEALARGVIDGCQAYLYTVPSYKMQETCKFINMSPVSHLETEYLINKDTLAKMPPDIRKIYMDTWRNFFVERLVKYTDEIEDKIKIEFPKKWGVDMYKITPAEEASWKKLAEKINDDFYFKKMRAKGIDGKKIVDTYQAYYEKYKR